MSALPAGFAALEPFAADWVGENAAARDALRGAASAEQRQAFYAAMQPLLGEALALLDAKPLAEHDRAEQRLMRLVLTFPHIAQAIEVQGPDEAKHAMARRRLPILRATADA